MGNEITRAGRFTFDDATGALLVSSSSGTATDTNITEINGTPVALGNPLPVELSDGTNPFGTSDNPLNVTIQGAAATGGAVRTTDGTPGTQFIFQEILMELRAIRKVLFMTYEESGQGNLAPDLIDDVNNPTEIDYN